MKRICNICPTEFTLSYRGWYHDLVPPVCSGFCYLKWLQREGVAHTFKIGLDSKAFPTKHVNADRRSSYERLYEAWLKHKKLSYSYEPFSFDLGDKLLYVPDFLINLGTFVEIKGLWNSRDKSKIRRFEKTGRHIHVVDEEFLRRLKHDLPIRSAKLTGFR